MHRLKSTLRRVAGKAVRFASRASAAQGFYHRGLSLSQAGRWEEALQAYKRGLSLTPRDIELWRALLTAPREAGYAGSLKALLANATPADRRDTEHGSVITLREIDDAQQLAARYIGMEFRDRDLPELERLLNELKQGGHIDRRLFKSLSDYFWENGPVEYALLPSELYLKEDRHLHLLFRASEIYALKGNNEGRRIGYLEELIKFDAAGPTDYLVIALSLTRLRRWREAVRVYEDGLTRWPDDIELWRGYAESSVASKTVFSHFVKYIEHQSTRIANIVATLSPNSAVYFIKHLKRQGQGAVGGQITELIIQRLAKEDLREALEQAKSYIANSAAWNDFGFRDRFCDGLIEQWSGKNGREFAKAIFRVKLLRLFWAPLVFEETIDDEEFVRNFCSDCQKLALEAIELDDPVADLGPTCIAWQAIYTRAVPHLYSDAASALHDLCVRVWPRLTWTAPHVGRKSVPNGKIKIGFTCVDFMPMISGLMGNLDTSKFEKVFLRAPHPGPVGETARNWVARADRTVDLPTDSVWAVQEAIAREELDVIVAGPFEPMSIYPMMARLAPIQMTIIEPNWCDRFANLDYYITWSNAEPSDFKTYHKSPVALMQHPPYWLEMPPSQSNKPVGTAGRVLADAPAHKRVYVCPTQPAKLHPSFDEVLKKVLLKDPEGIVVFLRMDNSVGDCVQHRMTKFLGPLAERAVFLPALKPEEAHALLHAVDCVLDAYPLGGMSSSFIAAAIGTPTVSFPKEMPFGKWMGSIYDYIGVDGLTARSPDEYAEIAYRLASDAGWREAKAEEIRAKRDTLIESKASASEFEAFVLDAVKRHTVGDAPSDWVKGQWA